MKSTDAHRLTSLVFDGRKTTYLSSTVEASLELDIEDDRCVTVVKCVSVGVVGSVVVCAVFGTLLLWCYCGSSYFRNNRLLDGEEKRLPGL